MRSRVAIVAKEPGLRLAAAKAFDAAPPEWKVCLFDQVPPDADAVVVCDDVHVDGIRFDPSDPAAVVTEVARALNRSSPGRAVFVVGACGGAGTTSVSLHLARALAGHGSVCYLESDPNRGARHRLGLPEDAPAWDAVGKDTESLLRAAIPVEGSFRVLLMPDGKDRARWGRRSRTMRRSLHSSRGRRRSGTSDRISHGCSGDPRADPIARQRSACSRGTRSKA